jgi:ArsR family metal-binding transcriptional regulator
MSFLDSITLTRTLPCLAEPGRIIVIGKPSCPLDEVIPYLATLPSIIAYNPDQCTLTFRRQPGFLTVQREEVYITQVTDAQEGLNLLAALTESINAVWEHRQELVAVTASKHTPRPLDIWELLPRTNCKQCGEATCMAFAVGLLQQNRTLGECPILESDPNLADRQVAIKAMI